jgi:hypothetical protein
VAPSTRFSSRGLTRRQVLGFGGALGLVALCPARLRGAIAGEGSAPLQLFLSSHEVARLDAVLARLIPSDDLPGAREASAVTYVQGLLSALPDPDANCDGRRGAADLTAVVMRLGSRVEDGCPAADLTGDGVIDAADVASAELALDSARPLFGGGPFSGRQPFGDFEAGQATEQYPANSFENTLPMNRLQRLAWAVRLDGAGGTPELANNPLATALPDVDLRRQYRQGLAEIEQLSLSMFGCSFVDLAAAAQDAVLREVDADFHRLLTGHAIEGLLCAPEYGGNRGRIGWALVGFDGDSQPLGYTLGFDAASGQYIERADKPNSKANPREDCRGFSATVSSFLRTIARAPDTQPGAIFRNPYCFEVSS